MACPSALGILTVSTADCGMSVSTGYIDKFLQLIVACLSARSILTVSIADHGMSVSTEYIDSFYS